MKNLSFQGVGSANTPYLVHELLKSVKVLFSPAPYFLLDQAKDLNVILTFRFLRVPDSFGRSA